MKVAVLFTFNAPYWSLWALVTFHQHHEMSQSNAQEGEQLQRLQVGMIYPCVLTILAVI